MTSERLGQAPFRQAHPKAFLAPQTSGGLSPSTHRLPSGWARVSPPSSSGTPFPPSPLPTPPCREETKHKATSGLFIYMAWQETGTPANEPGRRPSSPGLSVTHFPAPAP